MTHDTFHDVWVISVFIAYFAVLIGIAVVRVRNMSAMSDYVLGRRRLDDAGFSSAGVHEWGQSALAGCFLVIGSWINWTFIAKRLRRYTIATNDSLTVPEFLERRFGDGGGALRAISAAFTIFFVIFYVTSGLVAGSKLLNSEFGLDSALGIVLTLIAVSSYTFIGGFLAVSRTDVFQAA